VQNEDISSLVSSAGPFTPKELEYPLASILCARCSKLRKSLTVEEQGITMKRSGCQGLLHSARHCAICFIKLSAILESGPSHLSQKPMSWEYNCVKTWLRDLSVKYFIRRIGPGRIEFQLNLANGLQQRRKWREPMGRFKIPPLPPPNTIQGLASTLRWLKQCLAKGRLNRRRLGGLPNRLIDVGEIGSPNVRLVNTFLETDSGRPGLLTARYATLSHRWGNTDMSQTTSENLVDHYRRIRLSSLTPNFQDAINLMRKLGERYIWIDALCIIQNNEEEWVSEGMKMGDIYENAHFTIAIHNNSPEEGFMDVASLRRFSHWNWEREAAFDSDVNESPLSVRGWVLQERLLSNRIAHFTKGGLYWEHENGVCAAGSHSIFYSTTAQLVQRKLSRPSIPRADVSLQGSPWSWFDAVERYSCCQLTREEDKLVAISGLAKRLQDFSLVDYLAGLWADEIVPGLLWRRRDARLLRPTVDRAGSWSWASLDGPIVFLSRHTNEFLSNVLELLGTQNLDGDEVMAETSGLIWLNGPGILKVRTSLFPLSGISTSIGASVNILGYSNPWVPEEARTGSTTLRHMLLPKIAGISDEAGASGLHPIGWCSLDEEHGDQEEPAFPELYCAIVAKMDDKGSEFVLLLEAVDRSKHIYRRIGMGEVVPNIAQLYMSSVDVQEILLM
jgi:hypothetical protein